jgi:hypothetical protein
MQGETPVSCVFGHMQGETPVSWFRVILILAPYVLATNFNFY